MMVGPDAEPNKKCTFKLYFFTFLLFLTYTSAEINLPDNKE